MRKKEKHTESSGWPKARENGTDGGMKQKKNQMT